MKTLYIALGSNMGDREQLIRRAIQLMAARVGRCVAVSSMYETAPWGFVSPNTFLNAAACLETTLEAEQILDETERIERELGRMYKSVGGAYADRPIDIDLLALGDEVVENPRLTLPHPHMTERRFVMEPLCEIAPEVVHPTMKMSYRELLHRLNRLDIEQVETASKEMVEALNRLMPQLTTNAVHYDQGMLEGLLSAPGTSLFAGRDETGKICGTYTLCETVSPTGTKMWLEDVVVDEACRGRGYGQQMIEHAVATSRAKGAKSLNLTSKPQREAANRLYRRCGFVLRDTNVYRYTI